MSGKFVAVGLVKITFPVEEIFTVELDGQNMLNANIYEEAIFDETGWIWIIR